jgi:hypothetical protein
VLLCLRLLCYCSIAVVDLPPPPTMMAATRRTGKDAMAATAQLLVDVVVVSWETY